MLVRFRLKMLLLAAAVANPIVFTSFRGNHLGGKLLALIAFALWLSVALGAGGRPLHRLFDVRCVPHA